MERIVALKDLSNIIVPIIIAIMGWGISLLFRIKDDRSLRQWKCRREKSDCKRILDKSILIVMSGFIWLFFAILPIYIVIYFYTQNTTIIKGLVFSVNTGIYLYLMISTKFDAANYKLVRFKKLQKIIPYILHYTPYIWSIWIWGFSIYLIDSPINNFVSIIIIVYYILVSIFMDLDDRYKYSYAILSFEGNSKNIKCPIENLRSKGNWIIIEDKDKLSELRYRSDKLIKVRYL